MNSESISTEPAALFFGVIIEDYPRNRRLREFLLRDLNIKSEILAVDDEPGYFRKAWGLLRRSLIAPRGSIRLIIVPEFSLKYAALAWVAAKYHRVPLIVDWFVGLYETRVGDWGGEANFRAKLSILLDRLAIRVASLVLTDTEVRAQMLQNEYGATSLPLAIPVGAPNWARALEKTESNFLRIIYYGSYQPLHGLELFIDALASINSPSSLRFTLIGSGNTRVKVERLLTERNLIDVCTFIDYVPENQLRHHIANADIVLGIFGESRKASTVIANKVWQGLACNRTVLTRTNPALSELRSQAGDLLVEIDSPVEIADYIDERIAHLTVAGTPDVPDIDVHLEAYVRSKYDVLRFELLQRGIK